MAKLDIQLVLTAHPTEVARRTLIQKYDAIAAQLAALDHDDLLPAERETVVERLGEQKGEAWLKGVVDNMARAPKGGDTDQIKAVASGECGVALTNTYYVARMIKSSKPEDRSVMEKVRVVFPNQGTSGTHVNIAGAAVAKHAKNKDNAIAFMEFLASPFAQDYFANGNNEFPAVKGLKVNNPAIKAMGGDNFKAEQIPLGVVAKNMTKVQQMLDRVGYK